MDPALDGKYQFTDTSGQELKQYFAAQTAYLSGVAFDIIFPDGKPDDGELLVRVSEEGGRVIEEKQIALSAVNDGAFTAVSFGRWIKKGSLYMLEILGGGNCSFQAVYTVTDEEHAPGSQQMYFEQEPVDGQAVVRYIYGFPLNIKNVVCLWAFVWMTGLILIELIEGGNVPAESRLFTKAEELLEKWQIPVLILEFAVILILIIRICRNEAVDWDEAFTWQITTRNNVQGMLEATAADVHPPLYYLLVMAAMAVFGQNIFVAKMVSVAGTAATCILGMTLVRKRWGVKTAIPFLLVAGLGTQMIYYNVNVRMYSWVIFFVTAAGLFAREIIGSGNNVWWIAFTLVSLGGVYTQYFSVVPLALLYLFLFVWTVINDRKQMKKWFICCIVTVVGYLPWLTVVVATLKKDMGGVRDDKLASEIGNLCKWAFENNIEFSGYMPGILFLAAAAGLILEYRRYSKKERAFLCFLGVIFWAGFGVCMAVVFKTQHFWTNRYLVDMLLFVWLFMLIFLAGKSLLTWGTGMVWLCILSLSSYTVVRAMELNTIPWIRQARELLAEVQDEEKIVYTYPTFDVLYAYYLPNAEFVWYEDVDFSEMGEEFYMIVWGGGDFPYPMYKNGILQKEVVGSMRLEEGVTAELWKIIYQEPEE